MPYISAKISGYKPWMAYPTIFMNPDIKSFIPKAPVGYVKWDTSITTVLTYMMFPTLC